MVAWSTEPKDIVDPQLVSASEGEELYAAKKALEKSQFLKALMQDIQNDTGPIPLRSVALDVLKKILEWADYHQDDEEDKNKDENYKKSTDIGEWDRKFLDVDQAMLFEIIIAANYLDIKDLLNTGCRAVANMIRGKSTEEIRKTFNIINDFTPEEEAAIRKENEWRRLRIDNFS